MKLFLWTIVFSLTGIAASTQPPYHETYRPQLHFSPKAHWMNDPNGMVFDQGVWHLFFQYYPDSSVWGPMHWGHAVSKDLVHWREQPIALYPDSLGYIFSGSAVVDKSNTSGFGKNGRIPLVAVFTQHDPIGASRQRNDFQNQSIAYSLDNGQTWTKYAHNPVLKNPGITDFRDPKVFWYVPTQKWIMTLAMKDRIGFYSSPDLKHWTKSGEFGKDLGAHGGVWECPDLFPLDNPSSPDTHSTQTLQPSQTPQSPQTWVLIVNINPGGPNGGSATQYFLGHFDGASFTPTTTGTRWLDYGPDEYAGVTWSNTGHRKIFLGWMSNWLYAQNVPTSPWRSANTIPRQLGLQKVGDSLYLTARPVKELDALVIKTNTVKFTPLPAPGSAPLPPVPLPPLYKIDLQTNKAASFTLHFSNDAGENTAIGYDAAAHQYFIDRRHSGVSDFSPAFEQKYTAPRISNSNKIALIVYADASSFELFADDGLTAMTALVFPHHPYTTLTLSSPDGVTLQSFTLSALKGIHN